MIRVYVCPKCEAIKVGSRRKKVVCYYCDETPMLITELEFLEYSEMLPEERQEYAREWMKKYREKKKSVKETEHADEEQKG